VHSVLAADPGAPSNAKVTVARPASRVPVFLRPCGAGRDAEAAQLGPLVQAPLELSEAGEGGQGRDVVPQPDGVLGTGEPADHRAEESRAVRRAEMDDRRANVPAGQCQRLLALGANLLVPPRVVQRVRQAGRPARVTSGSTDARLPRAAGASSAAPGASKISLLTAS
jgi:hypothetical protein